MKQLTVIEKKIKKGQELTKDDLIFLYEINTPIEGFGYQKDPRVKELRDQRNPKEDVPIVLECSPEQIAWNQDQITKGTKTYIGPLFPDVFKLEHLEHIYISFPEGQIRRMEATIGGISKEELIKELEEKFQVSVFAQDMLNNGAFTLSKNKEQLKLIRLTVKDLGFPHGATTEEIYKKAEELGLELAPAETGPQLRRQYTDQPMYEYLHIGMKQIPDRRGKPIVFGVHRHEVGRWLDGAWARPEDRWDAKIGFVFASKET